MCTGCLCVFGACVLWVSVLNWCIEYIYKSTYYKRNVLSICVRKNCWVWGTCVECMHRVEGKYGCIGEGLHYVFREGCVCVLWGVFGMCEVVAHGNTR